MKRDLFQEQHQEAASKVKKSLAERMRPISLSTFRGQSHLVGAKGIISHFLERGYMDSMIFWGPPGTGKTTLARLLARSVHASFEEISAMFSGVNTLKSCFEKATKNAQQGIRTVLFIDEIHRFNKAQQDVLLPILEEGSVCLIGATTENPSFSLNAALLSRTHLLVFKRHDEEALNALLRDAERLEGRKLPLDEKAVGMLVQLADGDARSLLMMVETLYLIAKDGDILNTEEMLQLLQTGAAVPSAGKEEKYNLISALHKSIRGSDADAALYYFSRMVLAGEDLFYIGRRLCRMAAEDIGLADPQALVITRNALEVYHFLGSPEGDLVLAQACLYLATAPKSNKVYLAYHEALEDAKKCGSLPPPKYILNAPTSLMKNMGYASGYIYDHDVENAFSGQNYFPDSLGRRFYYHPVERGFEREIKKRMAWWYKLREERKTSS